MKAEKQQFYNIYVDISALCYNFYCVYNIIEKTILQEKLDTKRLTRLLSPCYNVKTRRC